MMDVSFHVTSSSVIDCFHCQNSFYPQSSIRITPFRNSFQNSLQGIAKSEATLKRVREVKKGYNYEMRMSLKNDPRRHEYAEKLKAVDERIAALETELKWAKTEANKKSLFKGSKGADGSGTLNENATNDTYLTEAKKIQDKTEASLQSALGMVEASKQVGANTMDEVNRQKEQIAEITDTVEAMEDGLTRADKLIRAFGRRIATDKFIQFFFVLNFGLLVGIIVWYAVKKGKVRAPAIHAPPMPTFDEVFGSGGGDNTSTLAEQPTSDGLARRLRVAARYLRPVAKSMTHIP